MDLQVYLLPTSLTVAFYYLRRWYIYLEWQLGKVLSTTNETDLVVLWTLIALFTSSFW